MYTVSLEMLVPSCYDYDFSIYLLKVVITDLKLYKI